MQVEITPTLNNAISGNGTIFKTFIYTDAPSLVILPTDGSFTNIDEVKLSVTSSNSGTLYDTARIAVDNICITKPVAPTG